MKINNKQYKSLDINEKHLQFIKITKKSNETPTKTVKFEEKVPESFDLKKEIKDIIEIKPIPNYVESKPISKIVESKLLSNIVESNSMSNIDEIKRMSNIFEIKRMSNIIENKSSTKINAKASVCLIYKFSLLKSTVLINLPLEVSYPVLKTLEIHELFD